MPVALAALGVLVGLGVGDRRADERRLLAAACSAVGGDHARGLGRESRCSRSPRCRSVVPPSWTLVLAAGICAATSLTLPISNPLEPRPPATRVIELGVLLPIVAGGLRAGVAPRGFAAGRRRAGGAGLRHHRSRWPPPAWLLLTRASSETDERVFAISALLLVGGVADALSLSALFGGLVAGVFWRYAGGSPRETIRRDVLFVQHPLLVLVLLVAGARAELSPAALALGAGYVALRVAGKLAGGAAGAACRRRQGASRSRAAPAAARRLRRGVRAERGQRVAAPTRRC